MLLYKLAHGKLMRPKKSPIVTQATSGIELTVDLVEYVVFFKEVRRSRLRMTSHLAAPVLELQISHHPKHQPSNTNTMESKLAVICRHLAPHLSYKRHHHSWQGTLRYWLGG